MADLIIPGLIIAGLFVVVAYGFSWGVDQLCREEEEEYRDMMHDNPLREVDPCDTCVRESECMGVDKSTCPRCNSGKHTAEAGGDMKR